MRVINTVQLFKNLNMPVSRTPKTNVFTGFYENVCNEVLNPDFLNLKMKYIISYDRL